MVYLSPFLSLSLPPSYSVDDFTVSIWSSPLRFEEGTQNGREKVEVYIYGSTPGRNLFWFHICSSTVQMTT